MASGPNSYCARLNLPVPRVEDFVGLRQIKLFDLLVVALLERGQPTSLEAIATRLACGSPANGSSGPVWIHQPQSHFRSFDCHARAVWAARNSIFHSTEE